MADEMDLYRMQNDLQNKSIDYEQSIHAPNIVQQQQAVQAVLVEQTNPIHILNDIELKLRGYRQKWDGSYEQITDPWMNSKGISRMIFILSTLLNQSTILSHLETEEIHKVIVRTGDDIIDDLVLNWKDYGITDKMILDHIVNAILFPSFFALKRAWKQNEKNWLNKAVIENIGSPRYMPEKKGGFLDKLKL